MKTVSVSRPKSGRRSFTRSQAPRHWSLRMELRDSVLSPLNG